MSASANDSAAVFKRYRRQLRAFIVRRVDSAEEAEDILQEVFLRFVQTDAIHPVGQVAAWLFRVARNRIIDRGRKFREERLPRLVDDEGLVCEITALLADDNCSPEVEYLRTVVWDELDKALDELPRAQRDVFELTELEGYSFRELSEWTGVPVATLLSRKHYAVKYLRCRLAGIYEAFLSD